ncbi:copper transporter family protein [Nocardiopsis sp. RV163]|uniref:copper transporter family protein n=1 Tax=Nocardiopsis sp. RV163 TaxID=1661388 RepID=UPI00069D09EF|nr:copper transporter family protein [Nocardiopsis sp. RV163]
MDGQRSAPEPDPSGTGDAGTGGPDTVGIAAGGTGGTAPGTGDEGTAAADTVGTGTVGTGTTRADASHGHAPTRSTIRGFPHRRSRWTARGNRLGLLLTGLVLLVGGGAGLAVGGGLFGDGPAAAPLTGLEPVARVLAWPWTPHSAAAVALVLTVLSVRWLLLQGRAYRPRRLLVGADTAAGRTEVSPSAAGGALVAQLSAHPRVVRGRARFTESAREPRLWLDLVLTEDADPVEVWHACRDDGVDSLRESLELERLPTVVRMSASGRSGGRDLA